MKTNSVERVIQSQLSAICPRCFQAPADVSAEYPLIAWETSSTDISDMSRDDIFLDISIWFRAGASTQAAANDIADRIERALDGANLPQRDILPTFYRWGDRRLTIDDDKTLRRIVLRFVVQNYENEVI